MNWRAVVFAMFTLALASGCDSRRVGSNTGDGGPADAVADSGPADGSPADGSPVDSGPTDAGPPDCVTLNLHDCRLEPGCAPDLCLECTCTPTFYGCRVESDPPYQCPILECPQPLCCNDDSECDPPLLCVPLGQDHGCGMCNTDPGDCGTDSDCLAGDICDPIRCACYGQTACTPGCSGAGDCPEGNSCLGDPDHPRCQPTPCASPTDCPPDFDCGPAGTCTRRICTSELVCDGYCVLGKCYAGLGSCANGIP